MKLCSSDNHYTTAPTVNSIHPKNYKNQKLGNKKESDTEDSTVQGLKDRKKRKGVQKKKLVHNVKVILILLLKKLSHQKI